VLACLLAGLIFLPQHNIQWPFHHWKLYIATRDTLPESHTLYRLVIESEPPVIYHSYDLFTVDDIRSRQFSGERVMWLAVNGDGRQRRRNQNIILSQLKASGLGDYPVHIQKCEMFIHYDQPFDPLTTQCNDLFTVSVE
jgi:hypothetical protein